MTSSKSTVNGGGSHILVVPFPGQGHLLPLLDLTHLLLTRAGGTLTVTVAVTTKNLPLLQPILSRHPLCHLRPRPPNAAPRFPSLPVGAENTKDLPPSYFNAICAGLRTPLLRWFCTQSSPPSAILSDEFLGWTHQVTSQLGIKRIVYSCTATFAHSIALYIWTCFPPLPLKADKGEVHEDGIVSLNDAPGKPEFPWWQLMLLYKGFVFAGPTNIFRSNWGDNFTSWGVVFNSFVELEGVYRDLEELIGP